MIRFLRAARLLGRQPGLWAFSLTLMSTSGAFAQLQPTTWNELLDRRIRTAYLNWYPEGRSECASSELPTEAHLIGGSGETIGRTWNPGVNQSHWEPVAAPISEDTLPVRVVALWCTAGSRSVLVESRGRYLEIDGSRLASVGANGELWEGVLAVSSPEGMVPLSLRERCEGGACTYHLVNALLLAGEQRAVLEARAAEERARMTQAARRAESQSEARLRTGAAIGARANALAQAQRVENLQRYGASAEQAQAILAGRVLPGMTSAMVRAALGEPVRIRREDVNRQTVTIWTYETQEIRLINDRVEP